MKLSICGLFMLLLAYTIDGRHYARRVTTVGNRRRNAKNRGHRRALMKENRRKCEIARQLFASPSNTCAVPPQITYKNMYEFPAQMDLWNFYQKHCATATTSGVFSVVAYIFLYIGWCYYLFRMIRFTYNQFGTLWLI